MAWMLEAANGEDTVQAPRLTRPSPHSAEDAASGAEAATRAAAAAAEQRCHFRPNRPFLLAFPDAACLF